MKSATNTLLAVIAAILVVVAYLSIYTVNQSERALVLRLGEIVQDSETGQGKVMMPGLHIKLPFITNVKWFDARLRTLNVQSSRILTQEQKYVLVDYFVKWRIKDFPLYYKRTSGIDLRTQTLLQQKVNDALRAAFGKRTISEVISGERMNIMALLKEAANTSAHSLGVNVTDVRIKRIDLPKEVSESVFSRMRAEREQVATKHRSDGKAEAEKIRANADANVIVTLATAKNDAAQIRAKGLADAANIYATAYNKDAKFYAFYRSLIAYKTVFHDKNSLMVLEPGSQFFKYFHAPTSK